MPVWVVFEVKCPTVNLEDVRIVGSLPELGSWEPSRALPLSTSEHSYPSWRSAEVSLPSQMAEVVQYKYIKVFDGSLVQWEDWRKAKQRPEEEDKQEKGAPSGGKDTNRLVLVVSR
ncbi:4-alpha-D-glucan glucanohydrolase) [Durusdinium trenchii]|uniref:4-alpha-D-glucan glucanohydrolase n=1 Tax=Durusdinium trenchii TaxID=1381693 RepID=A0ABP0QD86_9DINO